MRSEEARGWVFGAAFGFLLAVIFLWSWPASDDQHDQSYDNSPYGHSTQHEVSKTPWEWLVAMVDRTGEDPIAFYTLVLSVLTGGIGIATIALWIATRATEVNKRSIVRGSGQKHPNHPGIFIIEASNAGTGPALIETVEFVFGPPSMFAVPPQYGSALISNEMLHPQVRTQPVKLVRIPTPRPPNQVICVRLTYRDVNRRRRASIAFVMLIDDPAIPPISVFVSAPAPFLEDTFPVDE